MGHFVAPLLILGATASAAAYAYQGYQANEQAKRQAKEIERQAAANYKLAKEDTIEGMTDLFKDEQRAYGTMTAGAAAAGVKIDQYERVERLDPEESIKIQDDLAMTEAALGDLKPPDEYKSVKVEKERSSQDPDDPGATETYTTTERVKKTEEEYAADMEAYNEEKARLEGLQTEYQETLAPPDTSDPEDTLVSLRHQITEAYTSGESQGYRNLEKAKLGLEAALFNAEETRRAGEAAFWSGMLQGGGTLLTMGAKGAMSPDVGGWGLWGNYGGAPSSSNMPNWT